MDFLLVFIVIFLLLAIITLVIALVYLFQELRKEQLKNEKNIQNYENEIQDIKIRQQYEIEKARQQSVEISRRTIKGQVAEQLAPHLKGFPYLPSDSHFIGDPIDYIVFNGYSDIKDDKKIPDNFEIVLIDIKYNLSNLTERQKQIAKAIKAGKVRFETVRVNEDGKISIDSFESVAKTNEPKEQVDSPINNSYKNWYAFLKRFPNAYEPWSEEDDKLLKGKYLAGMKINELAHLLKRNHGKIRARLKEKNLLKKK